MESSTTPIVFKPRRYSSVLSGVAVFLSLLLVAAGLACFYAVGLRPFSVVFTFIGVVAAVVGVGSMFTRTVVTAEGITKQPAISGGFRIRWQDVESWEHLPHGIDDTPCVRFRIRGSRVRRYVFDYEVEQPGFETFLSYVRQHLSRKPVA